MSNSLEIQVVSPEEPLLQTNRKLEDVDVVQLKPRYTIFLSHSGAHKDFVEQLCKDLEQAKLAPLVAKRPHSLPKGELYAQLSFQAARQRQLAIVVVSEKYFSRSKWPRLELAAFVQAQQCTILPLFLGLSCKECGDLRSQAWFGRWEAWAQEDARVQVDVWKDALNPTDRRKGVESSAAFGEVAYRKEVVASANCDALQKNLPQDLEFPKLCFPVLLICFIVVIGVVMTFFTTSSLRILM